MAIIDELRRQYKGYADDEIIAGLKATQFADYSEDEIAAAIGYKPSLMARAQRGLGSTTNAARIGVSGQADVARLVAEDQRSQLPATAEQQKMRDDIAPAQQEYADSEGWGAVMPAAKLAAKRLAQFATNPREFAGMMVENLPNSLPGLAGSVAGGVAGGVAGPVGSLAGSLVGGTAGGYLIEQGAALREQIVKEAQARGVDPKDAKALEPIVAEKYAEFLDKARLKGIGTAGTDAVLTRLTLGLAGAGEKAIAKEAAALGASAKAGTVGAEEGMAQLAALEARNAARNTLGAKVKRGAAITGAEMFGEGASEAAGQKLAYGKVDALDVVDESLMGLGQGVAMGVAEKTARKALGMKEASTADQALRAADSSLQAMQEIGAAESVDDALGAFARATATTPEGTETIAARTSAARTALADPLMRDALKSQYGDQAADDAMQKLAMANRPDAPLELRQRALSDVEAILAGRAAGQPLPTGDVTEMLPVGDATELEQIPTPDTRELSMGEAAQLAGQSRFKTPQQIADEGLAEIAGQTGIPTGEATELGAETVEPAPALDYPAREPRGTLRTAELDPAGRNAVAQEIERLRKTNTLAARAYVREYEAGRITDADVMAKLVPAGPETAQQRIEAAARQAPGQPTGLIVPEGARDVGRTNPPDDAGGAGAAGMPEQPGPSGTGGGNSGGSGVVAGPAPSAADGVLPGAAATGAGAEPALTKTYTDLMTGDGKPYGTRAGAAVRAKKEGGEVIEVDGGWIVRTGTGGPTYTVSKAPFNGGGIVNTLVDAQIGGAKKDWGDDGGLEALKATGHIDAKGNLTPKGQGLLGRINSRDASDSKTPEELAGEIEAAIGLRQVKTEQGVQPTAGVQADAGVQPPAEPVTAAQSRPEQSGQEPGDAPTSTAPRPMAQGKQGVKHPRTVMGSRLLAEVSKQLNGLDPAWIEEFSFKVETAARDKNGEPRLDKKGRVRTMWRNPLIPGIGKLFREGGTQDLELLANVLEGEGYLEPGSVEADSKEAGERAKQMVRDALSRTEALTHDEQQAETMDAESADRDAYYAELDAESAAEAEAEREAIMAESGYPIEALDDLADDDIPLTGGSDDKAALMRELGFTEQEIADEIGQEGSQAPESKGDAARDVPQESEADRAPAEAGAAAPGPEQDQGGLKRDPEALPEGVRRRLQDAITAMNDLGAELIGVEAARGKGVTLHQALVERLPEIRKKRETLDEFRKHAERNGFDAEAVIKRLGSDLDLEPWVVNNKTTSPGLPADERLLLMPCCDGKLDKAAPAGELYQGVMWQTLRAHQPAGGMPNMLILSAKHGLIDPAATIEPYDERMTAERVPQLRAEIADNVASLAGRLKGKTFNDVLIVGGSDYRTVMADAVAELLAKGIVRPGATVNNTAGMIGEQRQKLGDYLRAVPGREAPQESNLASSEAPETPPKFADYNGDRLEYTKDSILWALQPGRYGGSLTLQRLNMMRDDPEAFGKTPPEAETKRALDDLVADGRIEKQGRSYSLADKAPAAAEPEGAAVTPAENAGTDDGPGPAEAGAPDGENLLTEAQARDALTWSKPTERRSTKRIALKFADPDGGGTMQYGEVSKYIDARNWSVDGGGYHADLKAAKAEAVELALERLKRDGYVEGQAQEQDDTPTADELADDAAQAEGQKLLDGLSDDAVREAARRLGVNATSTQARRTAIAVKLITNPIPVRDALKALAGTSTRPERSPEQDAIITLRKRESVLQSLLECVGK